MNGETIGTAFGCLIAGSWIASFLSPQWAHLFRAYRQIMYWFEIREDCRSKFLSPAFPIFIWILGIGAAVGEVLAEQVIEGKSKIDISSFSLKRFKDPIL